MIDSSHQAMAINMTVMCHTILGSVAVTTLISIFAWNAGRFKANFPWSQQRLKGVSVDAAIVQGVNAHEQSEDFQTRSDGNWRANFIRWLDVQGPFRKHEHSFI